MRARHFSAEIGEELAKRHRQTERREEKRRTRTRMPAAAGSSAAKAATSALTRVSAVSPALKKFLGVTEISRPETMKRIWSYIKDHNLQVGFRFISSLSLALPRHPALLLCREVKSSTSSFLFFVCFNSRMRAGLYQNRREKRGDASIPKTILAHTQQMSAEGREWEWKRTAED